MTAQEIMLYAVVGYCIGDLIYKVIRIIEEVKRHERADIIIRQP